MMNTYNRMHFSKTKFPFCIAEIGLNHNGDLSIAKEMILAAKLAGADAVKFQTYLTDDVCLDNGLQYEYKSQNKIVKESMYDLLKRCELKREEWITIFEFCQHVGIEGFSTPASKLDLNFLVNLGVNLIKVGSDDLTNIPLIHEFAKCKLPIILSIGMADIGEVQAALLASGWFEGAEVALLVCTSQYPALEDDINILRVRTLKNLYPNLKVGFSDHSIGSNAAVMATALGACIFEKHFTLDQNFPGPDHWFSETPESFSKWVNSIKQAYRMLGTSNIIPSSNELQVAKIARRNIVSNCLIKEGESFTHMNLALKRAGSGLPANFLQYLIGKKSNKKINRGSVIEIADIKT